MKNNCPVYVYELQSTGSKRNNFSLKLFFALQYGYGVISPAIPTICVNSVGLRARQKSLGTRAGMVIDGNDMSGRRCAMYGSGVGICKVTTPAQSADGVIP